MDSLTLGEVARFSRGEILCGLPGVVVRRVNTDSRQVQNGDLFVALAGDRFDGHDYLAAAARQGATAILSERAKLRDPLPECAVVVVPDTRRALADLAAGYRRQFTLPVVAVAGSNGKTTTKELLAAVLGQQYEVLASEASFNNDIGVPLTLLRLEAGHEAAVLEVGTNHPGELEPLVRMIQPRYGVVTSIGREHLEHFRDLGGVVREEGWLAELLPADGKLFVPAACYGLSRILARTVATVVRVGAGPDTEWQATNVRLEASGTTFTVEARLPEYSGEYRLTLLGRHQVNNALLALAVGAELGLTADQLRAGLADCPPAAMRLRLNTWNDVRVLDDTYNANVDSMCAALETFQGVATTGRRVAVLGDMAELGDYTPAAHAEVGQYAARTGVQHLFAVGRMAQVMADGAREAGLTEVHPCAEVEAAAEEIQAWVRPGDWVLVKASRATRLERVVERLKA